MFELGQTITHYEVTGLLGPLLGGDLYRGVQTKTGLQVSLWTVGPSLLPTDAARKSFVQKAARVYGVRHPNAQGLVDLFVHQDLVVIVSAASSGVSLAATMAQKKTLPRNEAFTIIEQVASAVSQYHQQDIVLGDVLPELVWVHQHGATLGSLGAALLFPRPRFLDAARKARRWSWLAPEIRLGHQGDTRSDIYSVAALAHFVLYGVSHPYSDGIRRGMFGGAGHWLSVGSRPRAPKLALPLVDAVLKKALSGYLSDRPREVETLCEDLRRALASTPLRDGDVAGAPPSAPPLAWGPPAASAPPSAPTGARTVQANHPMPPPSASSEQPRTMMAEAPRSLPAPMPPPSAPAFSEQPRTIMAEAPRAQPAPEPPRTMMASAPTPEMLAAAPRAPMAASAPVPQSTMMMSAPTPEMLAAIPKAPAPRAQVSTPIPAAAPAPQSTMMMSAPTPEMLAKVPGAPMPPVAAPAPLVAPRMTTPSGNFQTQPINLAHLDALLAETSEKAAAPAPIAAPVVNSPEKKTTEIDAAEVNRLLGQMRRDD